MADSTTPPDALFRIVIKADINRVWRELTKTDEAQGAVFNAWLHTTGLAPGRKMQMRTGTGKHVLVEGEVVEFDPPRRFVHTHRFTQYDDPVCQVAYELKPVADGVEVTLQSRGHGRRHAHRQEHAAGRRHDPEDAQGHRGNGQAAPGNAAHVHRLRTARVRAAEAHQERALAALKATRQSRRVGWTTTMKCALLALLASVLVQRAFELRAEPPGERQQFIYVLRVAPGFHEARNWTDKETAVIARHFERLAKAAESGQVILAGRSNEALADTFGVVIFEADDAEAARQFMETDPAVVSGLMSATLHPYAVALQRKPRRGGAATLLRRRPGPRNAHTAFRVTCRHRLALLRVVRRFGTAPLRVALGFRIEPARLVQQLGAHVRVRLVPLGVRGKLQGLRG